MKDKPNNEDKILEEIRRRVLEFESQNQEQEDLENLRRANIQALDEMSSLNEQEIMRIDHQVRKEHELKAAKAKRTRILTGAVEQFELDYNFQIQNIDLRCYVPKVWGDPV